MPRGTWTRDANLSSLKAAKPSIEAACKRFIAEHLKPRFLPEVRPQTEFNYPIDIHGTWHGNNWRFMVRYQVRDTTETFDAPFARLEGKAADRFDISWHRHTGKWHPMFADVTLAEAFDLILSVPTLQPAC